MRGVWASPELLAKAKSAESKRRHEAEVRDLTRPGPIGRRIVEKCPHISNKHWYIFVGFLNLEYICCVFDAAIYRPKHIYFKIVNVFGRRTYDLVWFCLFTSDFLGHDETSIIT